MVRNNKERQQAPMDRRVARSFTHAAFKKVLDNPTAETYTAATNAFKRAGRGKKTEGSGFSDNLRNIKGKFYDSWMNARDITTLHPTDYEYAYTQLMCGEESKPEINLGYIQNIAKADRNLLGYLTSLYQGTADMTVFFSYVAAIGYESRSFTYKALSERAAILGDPREKEYVKESKKATDSARAIAHAVTSLEPDERYTTELSDIQNLFEVSFGAEIDALSLDPRIEVTTLPENIKEKKKYILRSEVEAQALTLLYEKLDAVRGQLQGLIPHTLMNVC